MTPLAAHYLALIPSGILALIGVALEWSGRKLIELSAWFDRTWPKP